MAKSKDTFKNGHIALMSWADWMVKQIIDNRSSLGYPSQSSESKSGIRSGTYGSIVPDDSMPWHIRKTNRAVKAMPDELWDVVWIKYRWDGSNKERVNRYREATGKGKQAYYDCLEQAKAWVMGMLYG